MIKRPGSTKSNNQSLQRVVYQKRTDITGTRRNTGGEWSDKISYNEERQEMTVIFKSGFKAIYPNIDKDTYISALMGSTTKDGRHQSIGAWLHKHPGVMRNYRRG